MLRGAVKPGGDSNNNDADGMKCLPPVVDCRRPSNRDVLRTTIQRIGSDKAVTGEMDDNGVEQPHSSAAMGTGRRATSTYTLPGMVRACRRVMRPLEAPYLPRF